MKQALQVLAAVASGRGLTDSPVMYLLLAMPVLLSQTVLFGFDGQLTKKKHKTLLIFSCMMK